MATHDVPGTGQQADTTTRERKALVKDMLQNYDPDSHIAAIQAASTNAELQTAIEAAVLDNLFYDKAVIAAFFLIRDMYRDLIKKS